VSAQKQPDVNSDWQRTPFANLLRYKPSQVYFARLKVKGKLIRRSLKTNQLTVAKLRLADLEKIERQKAESINAVTSGKMTFGEALAVFQTRMQDNPATKPRTKEYYQFRIAALLKSWPGLAGKDISRITNAECLEWSMRNAKVNSSYSHNHTVSIVRRVFAIAMESGARYDNPGLAAQRVKARTKKVIELPEFDKFEQLVAEVKNGGSRLTKPASELVEFLAYGGFRKGEASFITWKDCDFNRGEIIVRGNPDTGTKNSEFRRVPMIPDMRMLLERMKSERPDDSPDTPVTRSLGPTLGPGGMAGIASSVMSIPTTAKSPSIISRICGQANPCTHCGCFFCPSLRKNIKHLSVGFPKCVEIHTNLSI
jgi:integrase